MVDNVWIGVNAETRGFMKTIDQAAKAAAQSGGKQLEQGFRKGGQDAGKAAADGLKSQAASIEAISTKLGTARNAEAQASAKVLAEEKKLEALRASGTATASQLSAAEDKVADAKRKRGDATRQVTRWEADLESAEKGGTTTSMALANAQDRLASARTKREAASRDVHTTELKVTEAQEKATAAAQKVQSAESNLINTRDRYGAEAKETSAAEKQLEQAKKQLTTANNQLAKAEGDSIKKKAALATANDQVKAKASHLKATQAEVAAAEKKVGDEAENAGKDIRGMGDSMDEVDGTGRGLTGLFDNLGISMGDLARAAGAAAAGYLSFTAVKDVLWGVGDAFDTMYDTIRVGTGASGEAFAGLQASARAVADTVPAMEGGMAQIGTTMADLNTRLGATGPELETLTSQFLQLQNLGVDADINEISKALTGFGISAADAPAAMDELFQVSQATGLSLTELAQSAVKGGPALREFGFGMAESAALVGQLDKAGMDADKTLAGMTRALSQYAAEGRDAPEALRETVGEIENFIRAGDSAAAIDLASGLFGTRGAAQFVDAVKSGTLSVEDFVAATGASSDTILGVAEETASAAEKWQLFKQQAMVAIEPVASAVFDALTPAIAGMGRAIEPVTNAMRAFGEWVQRNGQWLGPLVAGLAAGAGAFVALSKAVAIYQAVQNAGGLVAFVRGMRSLTAVTKLQSAAQTALNVVTNMHPFVRIATAVIAVGVALWAFFTKTEKGREIWARFTDFLGDAWERIKGFFASAWEAISPAWDGIVAGAEWVREKLQPVFDWIGEAWQTVVGFFTGSGEGDAEGGFIDTVKAKLEEFGTGVGQFYDTWIAPFVDAMTFGFDLLSQAVSWWIDNVTKPGLDMLGSAFSTLWSAVLAPIWTAFKAAVEILGAVLSGVFHGVIVPAWNFVGSMISSVWNNIIRPVWDFVKAAAGLLSDILTGNFDNIGNRFSDMGQAISDIVHGVIQVGLDFFRGLVEMVGQAWESFKDTVARVVGIVVEKIQEMVGKIQEIPGKVKDVFTNAGEWLVNAGRRIINGLWEGMKNAWSNVRSWISNTLNFSAIGSLIGLSGGGVVAYRDGGITAYAQGGIDRLERYANGGRRGERHVAQIAPAGAWRVWAEPETGGEAYIPLAQSKRRRSTAILAETADIFGMSLVDKATGNPVESSYRGGLGPQHFTAFADGGIRTADEVRRFVGGELVGGVQMERSLQGAPYTNSPGPAAWGDCSSTQGRIFDFMIGKNPIGPRAFSTHSQEQYIRSNGGHIGKGPEGSFRMGWNNHGAMAHTSGTLPDGTNVEMGGGNGGGAIGGGAVAWDHPQFDHWGWIPTSSAQEAAATSAIGDLSDMSAADDATSTTGGSGASGSNPDVGAGPAAVAESAPTTWSELAGSSAKAIVSGQVKDALSVFGVPDEIPPLLQALRSVGIAVEERDNAASQEVVGAEASGTSTTATSTAGDAAGDLAGLSDAAPTAPEPALAGPDWGQPFFVREVTRAAQAKGLDREAAVIGTGTTLVEAGNPIRMWANHAVPESLNYRHDAVGSDYDSVGIFQQRDNGAWGTVAQRMSAFESALMFFAELVKFDWQAMSRGEAAQRVQRSAFPSRYEPMMSTAEQLVDEHGVFASAPGYRDGGPVRGRGGRRDDAIAAWLSNGEYVVNADAAENNRLLLEAINGGANFASMAADGVIDAGAAVGRAGVSGFAGVARSAATTFGPADAPASAAIGLAEGWANVAVDELAAAAGRAAEAGIDTLAEGAADMAGSSAERVPVMAARSPEPAPVESRPGTTRVGATAAAERVVNNHYEFNHRDEDAAWRRFKEQQWRDAQGFGPLR